MYVVSQLLLKLHPIKFLLEHFANVETAGGITDAIHLSNKLYSNGSELIITYIIAADYYFSCISCFLCFFFVIIYNKFICLIVIMVLMCVFHIYILIKFC